MPRVNMETGLLSEPRVRKLTRILGWHMRETLGALFLVWAPCYERKTPMLTAEEVDLCADHDGFADAMVQSKMATAVEDGLLRMAGVSERIKFLLSQSEKGRKGAQERWLLPGGGRADSGMAQDAPAKPRHGPGIGADGPGLAQQNPVWPSDLVPDLVPVPDLGSGGQPGSPPSEDPCGSPARFASGSQLEVPAVGAKARKQASPRKAPTRLPDGWTPSLEDTQLARELGVDVARETETFRDHARANDRRQADWPASFRNWLRGAAGRFGQRSPAQARGGPAPLEVLARQMDEIREGGKR
jgi:hypothetical protein